MIKAFLNRLDKGVDQTLGRFTMYDGLEEVFSCVTLELPDKGNKTSISSIPIGTYKVVHRHSKKYLNHLILLDVPNRRYILIHSGNFYTDTRGCILVGSRFEQINSDSLLDITASKRTLTRLLEATDGCGFELIIS
jgi:hypothetical protein